MEQEQEQQQQVQVQPAAHLKCPRCASSNTKFCYYNNYSLSQPRYLCKACKRYWTRGGTLRNVPVGGKCRKNKRDKQSSSSSISSSTSMVAAVKPISTTVQSSSLQVDVSSSSTTRTHINNPLFSKRDGKDLSFSQFCMGGDDELGFLTSQNLKPAGEDTNVAAISNQVFSGYPLFGISSSTATTTSTNSTMASIIASCLHQQNMEFNGFKESAQTPYGVLGLDGVHDQMVRNDNNGELGNDQLVKDAKIEGNENKFEWKAINGNQNYNEEMKFSSDVPFMWNSSPAAWLDSSNIGSSVPSLI